MVFKKGQGHTAHQDTRKKLNRALVLLAAIEELYPDILQKVMDAEFDMEKLARATGLSAATVEKHLTVLAC